MVLKWHGNIIPYMWNQYLLGKVFRCKIPSCQNSFSAYRSWELSKPIAPLKHLFSTFNKPRINLPQFSTHKSIILQIFFPISMRHKKIKGMQRIYGMPTAQQITCARVPSILWIYHSLAYRNRNRVNCQWFTSGFFSWNILGRGRICLSTWLPLGAWAVQARFHKSIYRPDMFA